MKSKPMTDIARTIEAIEAATPEQSGFFIGFWDDTEERYVRVQGVTPDDLKDLAADHTRLASEVETLRREKEDMKFRNQLLRDRVDLPDELYAKRRKWYDRAMEADRLADENAMLTEALRRVAYEPKMTWETVREIARTALDSISKGTEAG